MDNKCSVCGGGECELGRQCKNTCRECYMLTAECACTKNTIQFKPKEKDRHEKLTDVLESDSYLCFWFNSQGNLMYRVSTKVTDEQLCYIEKMVSMVTEEILKSHTEITL